MTAIKDMYHPIIDDEGVFCSRVHIRKGKYQVQCMDTDQNMIDIDTINNCTVVPLVEVKGIFMKPRGYNPDIVLRGLVYIPPEKKHVENTTDFFLFHTEDTDDNDYPDYATEDEDTDNESEIDEDETPSQIPVEVSPAEVTPTTTKKIGRQNFTSFDESHRRSKTAAKTAEEQLNAYKSQTYPQASP